MALALLASGCASHVRDLAPVRAALVAGDVPAAVGEFEKRKPSGHDLLYLLEKGYLLHLAGRWEESNAAFETAERRAEDLYTKSLSREAAALVTSDLALPFRGMPYELQMVQYYRAINYLELGEPEEALVEARKANEKLAQYADKVEDDEVPRQDAFLQYVTGLLYESRGQANDAAVAMRQAARLYGADATAFGVRPPSWLAEDYLAVARVLGLSSEADSLLASDPNLARRAAANDDNNLVVFFESGFVPYREAVDITLPIFKGGEDDDLHFGAPSWYVDEYGHDIYAYRADRVKLDHVLRFSFPALVDVPSEVRACELVLPSGEVVDAEPALDLGVVARDEFERRLPKTLLKTVARAIAKETARRSGKKEGGEALGWLINAVNVATENADTRGCAFLPRRIDVLKASVPEGAPSLAARFRGADGRIVEEWRIEPTILPGRTTFVAVRSFR